VLCGHEHFYARAIDKKNPRPMYFICGNSGSDEHYNCNAHPLDPTRFEFKCDNVHFGAIKVKVTANKAIFEYYAVEEPNSPQDVYVISK
ncbi:MAG TPA: hypothetical protein VG603_07100, partial [Chitinophagales bacterium]|nr:hypothetical protein [Chitinophagales bacterium]